jgi:thioredoxin-related protein
MNVYLYVLFVHVLMHHESMLMIIANRCFCHYCSRLTKVVCNAFVKHATQHLIEIFTIYNSIFLYSLFAIAKELRHFMKSRSTT